MTGEPTGSRRARPRPGAAVALGTALALAATVAACSQADVPESLPGPTSTTAAPATTAPPPAGCSEDTVTRSLRPNGADASTGYMAEIRERGRLRVGVNSSKLLFSRVNPANGNFEGFDVELAEEVAIALFGEGEPGEPRDGTIEFVAVPTSDRVSVLTETDGDGVPRVDMVADTFTITCQRAEDIDFSSVYLSSGQTLLVTDAFPADTSLDDLTENHRVCAANGSTSLANLENREGHAYEVVGVPDQAECLVLLQQGEVHAVSTDETILAGMEAQDPTVQIVESEPFTTEAYGWGLPPGHEEWVRYVNGVLENLRSSGRWVELYVDEHLDDYLPDGGEPPAAAYVD